MDKQQGIAILTNIDKNIQLLLDEFTSLGTEALVPLMNAFSSKNEFDRNFATGTFDILKDIQTNLASNGTFEDRSNPVETKDMLTDIQAQVTNIAHNPYLEDIKNSKLMNFVLKRKGTLKQTWSHKRNEAKQAYESMINNQNKARIFDDWIQTEVFLPKKYRTKNTESTPEDQKHLLHKLGFLKMKSDVKSMQENAQKQSDKFDVLMDKMRDIIQNRESANVAEKMIELWDEDIANMKEKAIEESKKMQEYWKNQPHADEDDDETESIQNAEHSQKKPITTQSRFKKAKISHAAHYNKSNREHPYEEPSYQPLRNNFNQQRSYSDVVRTRYIPNRASSYSRYPDENNKYQKCQPQRETRRHFPKPKFSHGHAPSHQDSQRNYRWDYDYIESENGYNHNQAHSSHHQSSTRYNAPSRYRPNHNQTGYRLSTNRRYTNKRRETIPHFRNQYQPSPQNHFLW